MLGIWLHRAVLFYKYLIAPVDHDFRDRRIFDQLLQDIQFPDGIEQLPPELFHNRKKHAVLPGQPHDFVVNKVQNFGIRHLTGEINTRHNAVI